MDNSVVFPNSNKGLLVDYQLKIKCAPTNLLKILPSNKTVFVGVGAFNAGDFQVQYCQGPKIGVGEKSWYSPTGF